MTPDTHEGFHRLGSAFHPISVRLVDLLVAEDCRYVPPGMVYPSAINLQR